MLSSDLFRVCGGGSERSHAQQAPAEPSDGARTSPADYRGGQ